MAEVRTLSSINRRRLESHPTAMIERPGPVLRWFHRRFFREIAFPQELSDKISAAAQRGTVVYVCRTLSYIDYMYFGYALLLHGLPLSRFANGVKTLLMQPFSRVWDGIVRLWRERRVEEGVEKLSQGISRGDAALLFLRRPRTWLGKVAGAAGGTPGFRGEYVQELIRIQRRRLEHGGADERPILFVPLQLLWGLPAVRAAKAKKGIIDRVFGEREAPGRLRALWTFFLNYKESQVLGAEPIDLSQVVKESEGLSDEAIARRLRWTLTGRIESEIRVVLGPTRKGSARICEEVLRTRKLVAAAQEMAKEEGVPLSAIEKRARANLREIAADIKPWVFDVLNPLLSWVWRKIFDGIEIDMEGIERVRAAARKGPLVLIPSHKSHIDYLVLSYVFMENDLVPPHVAAGKNMSFFPLGFFFRRAGAFFLRRTFKGDRLYGLVFRTYVRKLLREQYNVEFFIEGGRSRTGKLLAPKLGLLGMIVEAALDDDGAHARRAQVVPISIGYEKVIEEKSYAHEAAGGEKKAEDVKGLLKATKVLSGEYGRLNIQFDQPFCLGEVLREDGAIVAWDDTEQTIVTADESSRRLATQRLAHRVVYGINRCTAITPTALAAAALLGPGRRGITHEKLVEYATFLMKRAQKVGGRLAQTVLAEDGNLDREALERTIELLARDGDLEVRGDGEKIYSVPDERRPRLAFYRNNAIHLFVAEGLIALAHATFSESGQTVERPALRSKTLDLSRLLKLEFTYKVGETFAEIFDQTLAGMVSAGLFAQDQRGTSAQTPELLSLLAGQVIDFGESYWVAARALQDLGGSTTTEKDLLRSVQDLGDKLFYTGEIRRREACVRANYQNAITYFKDRGQLVEENKKLRLAPGIDPKKMAEEIAQLLPSVAGPRS